MKKRVLAIICSAALCMSMLVGCGNSKKENTSEKTAAKTEKNAEENTEEEDIFADGTEELTDQEIAALDSIAESTSEKEEKASDKKKDDDKETKKEDSEVKEDAEAAKKDDEEEIPEEELEEDAEVIVLDDASGEDDLVVEKEAAPLAKGDAAVALSEPEDGIYHAEIAVKDYGTISLELDSNVAPITVANFVKLVNEGFYDGLTFHRIIDGFMIQGGDPLGNGTGGSDEKIKGEFATNGVENDLSHERGVISMARSNDMDSASSQFFIMHADADYLDGNYAAFGRVTDGMEVVDAICKDAKPIDGNGSIEKDEQPVIEHIVLVEKEK